MSKKKNLKKKKKTEKEARAAPPLLCSSPCAPYGSLISELEFDLLVVGTAPAREKVKKKRKRETAKEGLLD
jgi:hypothetical protein